MTSQSARRLRKFKAVFLVIALAGLRTGQSNGSTSLRTADLFTVQGIGRGIVVEASEPQSRPSVRWFLETDSATYWLDFVYPPRLNLSGRVLSVIGIRDGDVIHVQKLRFETAARIVAGIRVADTRTGPQHVVALLAHFADHPEGGSSMRVGDSPYGLSTGDLNHDGVLDLVTANLSSSDVSVLLGRGGGFFEEETRFPAGFLPRSVTVGDFDGDGNMDIAVANTGAADISVLLGLGDGAFAQQVRYSAGAAPQSIQCADLNSDGILDLVVANPQQDHISLLTGVGNGTFNPSYQLPVGDNPVSIATSDLNGDGEIDLVVANSGSDDISVVLQSFGGFASETRFAAGEVPNFVVAADLNGDSIIDIAVANEGSGDVSVLMGIGDGALSAQRRFPSGDVVFGGPEHLVALDTNQDGQKDLVVFGLIHGNVLQGSPDGSFVFRGDFMANEGTVAWASIAVDLDGDLNEDIVVTGGSGAGRGTVVLHPGVGNGQFRSPLPSRSGMESFLLGQFPSMKTEWEENSYGMLQVGGSVVGWLALPRPEKDYYLQGNAGYDSGLWLADALAVADAAGVRVENFDRVFLLIDDFDGVNAAFGSLGFFGAQTPYGQRFISVSWLLRGAQSTFVASHEFGHNLGWWHSGNVYWPYDSPFDVISGGCANGPHTIAFNKFEAGWMGRDGAKSTKGVDDNFTIFPTTRENGLRAVLLDMPDDRWAYSIEVRAPEGHDECLRSYPLQGVLIHIWDKNLSDWARKPVDSTPSDDTLSNAIWRPGTNFSDPRFGLRIDVLAANADGSTTIHVFLLRPPDATVVLPLAGQAIKGFVKVAARATDYTYATKSVEFFMNGVSLGVDSDGPDSDGLWTVHWSTLSLCSEDAVALTARSTDDRGNPGPMSPAVTVNVRNQTFPDVPCTHFAWRFVEAVARNGIASGFPDGTYRPANDVNRGQMAVFMSRTTDLELGDFASFTPPVCGSGSFSDVDCTHPTYKFIEYVAAKGIASGFADGTYKPGNTVNRGAMAVFLSRVRNLADGDFAAFAPPACGSESFPDVACSHASYKFIEYVKAKGIASGFGDSTYRPGNIVTRAQMAVFITRAAQLPL